MSIARNESFKGLGGDIVLKKELEQILEDGFKYRERVNSYSGRIEVLGIKWDEDLERKLEEYFLTKYQTK